MSGAGLSWRALPLGARIYVAAVIAAGAAALVLLFPLSIPRPAWFAALLAGALLTSTWKVNLPISLTSGSTLSVSYAADLMALLLLGPRPAMVIASVGALAQCTVSIRQPYPVYRTAFSVAAEAVTMAAASIVYVGLGGPIPPREFTALAGPLVATIATYFLVNTALVAGAIGLSAGRRVWQVWRDDFLWSAASFMVAGTAGAVAAIVIERGAHWVAVLTLAPIYLTYRTYRLFMGRLELLEREQAARASAEEANRLKDQFLATVSHELRTPLNAILGWADMLRSGKLDPSRRERALQAVYDSARRQAQLVDDLLDVSRIMSGKLRLQLAAVDIAEIVRAAAEIVQPAADAKRIRLSIDTAGWHAAFYGDGARLQQIVWNLLTNAVKFTPEGGAVQLHLRGARAAVEIVVSDSGEGITPDFLPSVFEPFRQGDGSMTRPHGGLGLGLSIVKHLVTAHGGDIRVESGGQGLGSVFTVRLPIVAVYEGEDVEAAHAAAREPAAESIAGLAVLVVDDDDSSREVVATYLESHQAEVLTASSAGAALGVLQSRRVDVLLADVAMPGEDGYSLIRKVRALTGSGAASVPAAALTAFARDEDRQQALTAGYQLHLTKPIDARTLIAAVARLGRLMPT
jgi:signal transduction histidine kinase/CheY-like chemotaxis protein